MNLLAYAIITGSGLIPALLNFLILCIIVGVIYAVAVRIAPTFADIIRLVCGAIILIALVYLLFGFAA
jgi:hypothetical protein